MQLSLYSILRVHLLKDLALDFPVFSKEELKRQLQAAEEVIQGICAEVYATVPQITGQIAFPSPGAPTPFPTSTNPRISIPTYSLDKSLSEFKIHPPGTFLSAARPSGMHHLVYPMWVVGQQEPTLPGLTQWAIGRLHFLAHTIGSRMPLAYAEDLRQKLDNKSDLTLGPRTAFLWGNLESIVSETNDMPTSSGS
jgi:hypothetical protein